MIEFELKRKEVKDIGLDESIKKLKPEQIEKAVNTVLGFRNTAARFKAPFETCIHCGLCSKACHWYHSFGGDPTYTPVAKVRMTLWEMIKRKGKVSPEFIRHCARIAFTECNLCRRCSMYCPYGLDIAYQLGMVRRICFVLGVVPQALLDYDNSLSATLTQLWISQGDWLDTNLWLEEEMRAEFKNPRIPIDNEGAEVMWSPQARAIQAAFARSEALRQPEDPRQAVFTVLPGHGVVMVEKWVADKAPLQVLWEYMDAGHLVVAKSVPQGAHTFGAAGAGRLELREEAPTAGP